MKKFSVICGLLMFVILLVCSGCGSAPEQTEQPEQSDQQDPALTEDEFAEYDTYDWSLALCTAVTHSRNQPIIDCVARIADRTNGHLNITLYGTGELPYKATELVSVASSGVVEITECSSSNVSGEWKSIGVITYPFLCTTWDGFMTMQDVVLPIAAEELENEWNCSILAFESDPLQILAGDGEPISSIDDFQNRKVRGNNAYVQEFLEMAGASSISVTSNEIAEAMSHSMIDSFSTGAATIASMKYYEYCDWVLNAPLFCTGTALVISNDVLASLPEEFQTILAEEFATFYDDFNATALEQHNAALQTFADAGLQIVEAPAEMGQDGYNLVNGSWVDWASDSNEYSVRALEAAIEALY